MPMYSSADMVSPSAFTMLTTLSSLELSSVSLVLFDAGSLLDPLLDELSRLSRFLPLMISCDRSKLPRPMSSASSILCSLSV